MISFKILIFLLSITLSFLESQVRSASAWGFKRSYIMPIYKVKRDAILELNSKINEYNLLKQGSKRNFNFHAISI